jgi:cytochrome c556
VQLSNGDWAQTNIRGNHIAVVEDGRAGTSKIMDSRSEGDNEDMDNAKLDRLCDLLEKLWKARNTPEDVQDEEPEAEYERAGSSDIPKSDTLGQEVIPVSSEGGEGNVNPVSARDARAALQNLRNLRPFIDANGDRKAIDAFNKAIRAVKSQIAAGSRASAADSRSRHNEWADAADFESRAARFHGKAIRLHADVNAPDDHTAKDARLPEESFDEAVERVRQEQMARFTPKRRR